MFKTPCSMLLLERQSKGGRERVKEKEGGRERETKTESERGRQTDR